VDADRQTYYAFAETPPMQLSTTTIKKKLVSPKYAELAILKNQTNMESFLLIDDEAGMIKAILKSKKEKLDLTLGIHSRGYNSI
jgi:hypothetical protein